MSRKIILLNVALVVVVAYAGYLFRAELQAGKDREAKMRAARIKVTPPPPLVPLANQPPVIATGYKDVAMKTLFHPSRNPDLPPPPPPPAPPPPPPMPPLPKFHGQMNVGDGPISLLSLGNLPSQATKIGESIGPFKLVDVNTVDITFEWEGQIARRTLDQLTDRTIVAAAAGPADNGGRSVSTPPPTVAPVIKQPLGPGETTSFGFKTCNPNDSMPEGTVQGGFRKVTYQTPFGPACRWDPVGR